MKKILFFITKADMGGAQKVVYELAKGMSKQYDVSLLVGRGHHLINWIKESELNIKIIQFNDFDREIQLRQDIICLIKLIKLINKNHYNIVHCHSAKAGLIGRLAAYICRVEKIVYTVHGWGSSINEYQSKYKNILFSVIERIMSWITTDIVVVSKADERIAKNLKISDKKIKVIYNGIDYKMSINKYDSRNNDFNIVTSARVTEQKDWKNTIMVLKDLKRRGIKYKFYWLGDGPQFQDFKKLVEHYKMSDSINLLGNVDNVDEFLQNADVFLLLSKWEGLPISIIEALFEGLPIIASNVGGINELVSNNVNGYLIENNDDIDNICNRITTLTNDYKLRETMARKSIDIASRKFRVDYMIKKYLNTFESLELQ